MKYDLVSLLTAILNNAGLSDAIDKDLSNHSTISLNMKGDIPSIHICEDNGEVWVWTKINEYNQSALNYSSAKVFDVMFKTNEDIFYCGQPCLYVSGNYLELRAQVKDDFLNSPERFLFLLDSYLTILQEYRMALA